MSSIRGTLPFEVLGGRRRRPDASQATIPPRSSTTLPYPRRASSRTATPMRPPAVDRERAVSRREPGAARRDTVEGDPEVGSGERAVGDVDVDRHCSLRHRLAKVAGPARRGAAASAGGATIAAATTTAMAAERETSSRLHRTGILERVEL